MKKPNLKAELDGLMSWAFDPQTKLKDLTVRGWEKFKRLREAGQGRRIRNGSVNF
jgi:hypothetical protein